MTVSCELDPETRRSIKRIAFFNSNKIIIKLTEETSLMSYRNVFSGSTRPTYWVI